MIPLQLHSEPYRPEGNIDARAARRAIGRPHLGLWEVFLRETLQNSWDARLPEPNKAIRYGVEGYWATAGQIQVLRDEVFTDQPSNFELGEYLDSGEIPILVVTDSRTKGLQGPTRADLATDEPTHFIDFVRNIGRAQDKRIGGGTYGFGKGVLYDASVVSTIVVFSRTTYRGAPVSRLIAIGQGDPYNHGTKRYTGRHWWGVEGETTAAEPLTGSPAEALAARLGMNRIPEGETGTSIAVVAPLAPNGETLDEIVDSIANAAMHWAWPHMIGTGSGATIDFKFVADGAEVTVPQPSVHPLYRHYAGAYRRATAILGGKEVVPAWPWEDLPIRSERPKAELGVLVYKHVQRENLVSEDGPENPPTDHVALMRDPRLVVKYLDVPQAADGRATIGVFVADPSVNERFAQSEPVAHDDWAPENLRTEKYQRNIVKQALEKVRRTFRNTPSSAQAEAVDDQASGAVRLANALGDLLAGIAPGVDPRVSPIDNDRSQPYRGSGAESRAGGSGAGSGTSSGQRAGPDSGAGSVGGRRRSEPAVTVVGSPRLAMLGTRLAAVFQVRVVVPEGKPVVIEAEPRVVLEGGVAESASDRPAGADLPATMGWATDGGSPDGKATFVPTVAGESLAELWVSQPADTAVTVVVRIREGRPA